MFITNWLGRLWCGAILENDTLGGVYERNIIISIVVGKGAFENRLKDGISYSKAFDALANSQKMVQKCHRDVQIDTIIKQIPNVVQPPTPLFTTVVMFVPQAKLPHQVHV
jgi:hypothetical protein